jgi:hypothetical protein
LQSAQTFSEQIGGLAGMGLSDELLKQIIDAGPKIGGQMATSILNAGPEGIKALNELMAQIKAVATTGVDAVAASLYGPGAAALSNYVAGLRSGFPELDSVMNEVASKVATIMAGVASAQAAAATLAAQAVTSTATAAAMAAAPTPLAVPALDTERLAESIDGLGDRFDAQNDRYLRLARSGAI